MDRKLETVLVPVTDVYRATDPQRQDYATFLFFDDPDGNTRSVQEVRRAAG